MSHMKRTNLGNGAATNKKRAKTKTMPPPPPSPQSRHTPEMEMWLHSPEKAMVLEMRREEERQKDERERELKRMEVEREREATVGALFSATVPSTIPPLVVTTDAGAQPKDVPHSETPTAVAPKPHLIYRLISPYKPNHYVETKDLLSHLREIVKWQGDTFVDALREMGYTTPPLVTTASVQTEAPTEVKVTAKPTVCVFTQTLPPPTRTYAEAVTQTVAPTKQHSQSQSTQTTNLPSSSSSRDSSPPPMSSTTTGKSPRQHPLLQGRAMVIHGIRTDLPLPITTRKVELETGKEAIGMRWLLPAVRRQKKKESSTVIYFMEDIALPRFLYFGGRKHRVELYEWDRGHKG